MTAVLNPHTMALNVFEDCLQYNYTHDMPLQRYTGPKPVLLYGRLQDFADYTDVLQNALPGVKCEAQKDYRVLTYVATTIQKFCMVREEVERKDKAYEHAMFSSKPYSEASGQTLEALPVQGRLVSVSLKGLRVLDYYYRNRYRSNRLKVKLKTNAQNPYDWAYMYHLPPARTFKYDVHTRKHALKEGVKFTSFQPLNKGGEKIYSKVTQ